jgi:uncharacterized linocin/CFP29 family protein
VDNNNSNGLEWAEEVWREIGEAVVKEVAKVRIAQKVFPTVGFENSPTEIPNDVIDFKDLSIKEGRTKPFVEIYQVFPLTSTQAAKEKDSRVCKTLSRMAAKAIALTEDIAIFQGQEGTLPANVTADFLDSMGNGLLGEANPLDADDDDPTKVTRPIAVSRPEESRPGVLFGENVFAAVADGIAKLVAKAQAPPYALFLPTQVYADTFVPPSAASLVTTAERIRPLMEGGFYGTGTLPPDKGLIVALGGDPTGLYVGREAATEVLRKDGSKFFFRVSERVQFVARDPRALVLLSFQLNGGRAAPGGPVPAIAVPAEPAASEEPAAPAKPANE